jgi:O-antigen/teichoic acid export membrane protein
MKRLWGRFWGNAAVATVLVQLITVGTQLGVDVVVARMLGPELTGEVVFALATAGLLSVVMLFGTGEVAVGMYARREVAPQRVLTASGVILSGGAVLGALAAAGIALWAGVDARAGGAVALAMAALTVNAASATLNQAIVGMDASKKELGATLVSRGVLVVSACVGAALGDIHVVLLAYVLAAGCQVFLRARLVHTELFELRAELDPKVLATLWRRGRHIGLGSLFGTVANRADTLALRAMCGAAQTGIYGAAYRVVAGTQVIASATSLALYPRLARGEARARTLYAAGAVGGAVGLSTCALWLPGPLIALVYGPEFAAAAPALEVLLLGAAAQWFNIWGSRWIVTMEAERALPWAQAIGCAMLVAGLAAWLPEGGAMGAAWATLASDGVVTLIMMVTMWKGRRHSA